MTQRRRLLNRRPSETFGFRWRDMNYTATTSRFPDGRLAEIFLSGGKINTDSDAIARDGGVIASIALQYGAEVATVRGALLRDGRGAAASPLGAALDQIAEIDASNYGSAS
ncbi:hypothetical protein HAP41_0000022365 [Bradyrhizobium barranii subsp. apii]|uniref:Uncharacterized protein n=1 Tax=Bradyrhizobium barranii subsp. apii TaxID=2819348 RepID=A0A8T5VED6_9BRAD|nr:hypothetical protein [Bradyrhizobium barranii]UPT91426.1 hypothetical protein HAP41_0000022365 [Bradyrhizobium barranii subsp. apii]